MAPARTLLLGLLLTACAGLVDAVGFIELGGYYTSFMSGNTTQLGIGAAMAGGLVLPFSLVVMFFAGSFAGSVLALRGDPRHVLALVIASLGGAFWLSMSGSPASQSMLLLAAGAGAQNAVLPFSGGARLGTTFVSGTLFAAGQDLAGALARRAPPWRWTQHLLVWVALLAGALAGALAYGRIGISTIGLPAIVYIGMVVGFSIFPRRQ